MRKFLPFFASSAAVLGVIAVLSFGARSGFPPEGGRSGRVTFEDGAQLAVEIAADDESWQRGLSGRASLPADRGLLFLFPRAEAYAFWMKEMRFPIDIIWINGGRIVDIAAEVPPPVFGRPLSRYAPAAPADAALEVRAGFAASRGLRPGAAVRIDSSAAVR